MTSPGILPRLKQETRQHHRVVERQLNLCNRSRTIHEYLSLLERLYGFYLPMESRLASVRGIGRLGLELDLRRKVPLLLSDLHVLGRDQCVVSDIALCDKLPKVDDVPQALGCLYVLEGATLGGQFIGREFEQRLGIHANHGGRFFASYGAAVAEKWKTFGAILTANAVGVDTQDTIVASGCATFDAFGCWLQ